MPNSSKVLALQKAAAAAYERQQFTLALKSARKANKLSPNDPYSLNLLGLILRDSGKQPEAERCFRDAIRLKPDLFAPYHNLATILYRRQQYTECRSLLMRCVDLNPNFSPAWMDLGGVQRKLDNLPQARACFEQAAHLDPANWQPWYNMARVLEDMDAPSEAICAFKKAGECCPDNADIFRELGCLCGRLKDFSEAELHLEKAYQLNPKLPEFVYNLAVAYRDVNKTDRFLQKLQETLQLDPHHVLANYEFGRHHQSIDELDVSLRHYELCLKSDPSNSRAKLNLAVTCADMGNNAKARQIYESLLEDGELGHVAHLNFGRLLERHGEYHLAESMYRKAMAKHPQFKDPQWNLSHLLLGLGKFEEGWRLYKVRHSKEQYYRIYKLSEKAVPRNFPIPNLIDLDRKIISKKHVLIWREQGVGDEVMFASVIPDVIATARAVTIECEPRYVTLFQRSFPQAIVRADFSIKNTDHRADLTDIDCHCAIGDLPAIFRRSAEAFPGRPYIIPDPQRVAAFRAWLDDLGRTCKVGISWRSGVYTAERARRHYYTQLKEWDAILTTPDATFINLLYGDCTAEIAETEARLGCRIHQPPDLDLRNDLEGLFALLAALDCVISAQSSIIDSAGSLGIPTLAWLPPNSIYRLTQESGKSLWYPSVRIIDRGWYDPWEPTIAATAEALQTYIQSKS